MDSHDVNELSFNAAKLFEHMSENLGCDPNDENEWVFTFAHEDFDHLMAVAEPFADALCQGLNVEPDDIACEFNEEPDVSDEFGKKVDAPPQFTLGINCVMTERQLAKLHGVFGRLAKKHKIAYAGVDTY